MANQTDDHWRKALDGPDAGTAWQDFLQRYGALLASVVRQAESDQQHRSDCFIYLCEQLSDANFRRLRHWQPQIGAQFSSWLRVVALRLCTDFRRHRQGRLRPNALASERGPLYEEVFRLRFGQQLSLSECYETLKPAHPVLSELRLAGIVAELNRSLSSRQHWHLGWRQRGQVSLNDPAIEHSLTSETSSDSDAYQHVESTEQQQRLQQAISRLEPAERLLLHLRFTLDLQLREVARLAGLKDAFQARYHIQRTLQKLKEQLAH